MYVVYLFPTFPTVVVLLCVLIYLLFNSNCRNLIAQFHRESPLLDWHHGGTCLHTSYFGHAGRCFDQDPCT